MCFVGLLVKLGDWENYIANIGAIIFVGTFMGIIVLIHLYVNEALMSQSLKLFESVSLLSQEVKIETIIKQEYMEILSSLEEGILVLKDDIVSFSNEIFKAIQSRLSCDTPQEFLQLHIWRIHSKLSGENNIQLYSLNELM